MEVCVPLHHAPAIVTNEHSPHLTSATNGSLSTHSSTTTSQPPPPPDPQNLEHAAATSGGVSGGAAATGDALSDDPIELYDEHWDVTRISGLGALRMLIDSLERLADATGDVAPTPCMPATMLPDRRAYSVASLNSPISPVAEQRRESAPPPSTTAAAAAADLLHSPTTTPFQIGSPEVQPLSPILTAEHIPSVEDEARQQQHAALARRFFSKSAPPFSLRDYLLQLHRHCPHSPGVYLLAATYLSRLCCACGSTTTAPTPPTSPGGGLSQQQRTVVPATARTIHRLSLAAIRLAAKSVEDNKWAQARYALLGGVSLAQMLALEVSLCFLLEWNLQVGAEGLARGAWVLQGAAQRKREEEGEEAGSLGCGAAGEERRKKIERADSGCAAGSGGE